MHGPCRLSGVLSLAAIVGGAGAVEGLRDVVEQTRLEAHGFVSFGWAFKTTVDF